MVPELHDLDEESAAPVQALRRHVAALGDHAHFLDVLLGEPAQRRPGPASCRGRDRGPSSRPRPARSVPGAVAEEAGQVARRRWPSHSATRTACAQPCSSSRSRSGTARRTAAGETGVAGRSASRVARLGDRPQRRDDRPATPGRTPSTIAAAGDRSQRSARCSVIAHVDQAEAVVLGEPDRRGIGASASQYRQSRDLFAAPGESLRRARSGVRAAPPTRRDPHPEEARVPLQIVARGPLAHRSARRRSFVHGRGPRRPGGPSMRKCMRARYSPMMPRAKSCAPEKMRDHRGQEREAGHAAALDQVPGDHVDEQRRSRTACSAKPIRLASCSGQRAEAGHHVERVVTSFRTCSSTRRRRGLVAHDDGREARRAPGQQHVDRDEGAPVVGEGLAQLGAEGAEGADVARRLGAHRAPAARACVTREARSRHRPCCSLSGVP